MYNSPLPDSSTCGRSAVGRNYKSYMKNSIARISLTLFIVVFLSTFFIPAMEGSLVPIFGFLVFVSIIILIVGNKKFKIAGICFLILSVTLLITDYRAGKEHRASFLKRVKQVESPIQD